MSRPFRFLAEARDIASVRELTETIRRAEAVGIDTLVIPDHLIEQMAPIPVMAAIAALSDRLRISAFVHNNDLRHPAVLAPGSRQPRRAEWWAAGCRHRRRLESTRVPRHRAALRSRADPPGATA